MRTLRPFLGWFALPALAIAFAPTAWSDALVFDRGPIVAGQFWRLWTGHWCHFSTSHLGWNLLALGAAATWLENLRPGRLPALALIGAPAISVALLAGAPTMHTYGGLSGLGTGVVTLLALTLLERDRSHLQRISGLAMLILVAAKLGFDALSAHAFLSDFGSVAIRPAPLAHFGGAIAAVARHVAAPRLIPNYSDTRLASSR